MASESEMTIMSSALQMPMTIPKDIQSEINNMATNISCLLQQLNIV